jgi:hypothetical protein
MDCVLEFPLHANVKQRYVEWICWAFTLGEQLSAHGSRGSYMGAIAQQRCIRRSAIVQHNLGVEDDQSNKVFEDAVRQ